MGIRENGKAKEKDVPPSRRNQKRRIRTAKEENFR